eukprot:Skav208028  [mRNA]  locus=scaffold2714:498887:511584:- [translate_table: standard]
MEVFWLLCAVLQRSAPLVGFLGVVLVHAKTVAKQDFGAGFRQLREKSRNVVQQEKSRYQEELLEAKVKMLATANIVIIHFAFVGSLATGWKAWQNPSCSSVCQMLVLLTAYTWHVLPEELVRTDLHFRYLEGVLVCMHAVYTIGIMSETDLATFFVLERILWIGLFFLSVTLTELKISLPIYICEAAVLSWRECELSGLEHVTSTIFTLSLTSRIFVAGVIVFIDHIMRSKIIAEMESSDACSRCWASARSCAEFAMVTCYWRGALATSWMMQEDPEQSAAPDAVPISSPDLHGPGSGPSSQGRTGSTVSEVVEFYDDLREFALLVSNETNLFDIKEVHLNFKRQSLVQDFDSGMPTLRRFIRPTDWHRIEQMFQIVSNLPPRDLQQRCTFRDPVLFRLPGESRSYLRSKLTSVYLAHEVVDYRRKAEAEEADEAQPRITASSGLNMLEAQSDSSTSENYLVGPEGNEGLELRWSHWVQASGRHLEEVSLELPMGRRFFIPRAAGSACFLDFRELCAGDRGEADFFALAKRFHTIFLQGVPRVLQRGLDEKPLPLV